MLEARARQRSSKALEKLLDLTPPTARLVTDEGEKSVPLAEEQPGMLLSLTTGDRVPVDGEITQGEAWLDEAMLTGEPIPQQKGEGESVHAGTVVQPGMLLRLTTGDRVPVDGEITQGEAWLDEAMLTGEPIPQQKGEGDSVHAGSVVQDGSVLFRASAVGSHTTLSRIIRMMRQAQSSKPEIGQLADKISAVFVPVVVVIALVSGGIQRRVLLDILCQHFGIDKAGIHIPGFIGDVRIAIAAGGVKAQRRHPIGLRRIHRFAFDFQIVQLTVFGHETDVGKLRISAGIRLHLRDGGQVIHYLLAVHIDIGQHIAERLDLHHIFVGDIPRLNGVADPAAAHHREIRVAARHLRRQQQVAHIGLHKAHFTAVALQMTIHAADFDLQLRLAFVLERRQQRHHLRVLGDLRRIQHPLALAVIVSHFFLQVDRDQLIVHQLHLAVAELKIGAADVSGNNNKIDYPHNRNPNRSDFLWQ